MPRRRGFERLVTLDQHVQLDVPVDDLAVHEPDYKNLIAFLKAMEFSTLTRRVAEQSGIDAGEGPRTETDVGSGSSPASPKRRRRGRSFAPARAAPAGREGGAKTCPQPGLAAARAEKRARENRPHQI